MIELKRFVVPRLQLKIAGDRAYCGRCGQLVGVVGPGGHTLSLVRKRGFGWVYTIIHRRPLDDGIWEFELKRRRHANLAIGGPAGQNGAEAFPNAIVRCPEPRCQARQRVPSG